MATLGVHCVMREFGSGVCAKISVLSSETLHKTLKSIFRLILSAHRLFHASVDNLNRSSQVYRTDPPPLQHILSHRTVRLHTETFYPRDAVLAVPLSVSHKSEFCRNGGLIELLFDIQASLDLSYAVV